MKHIIRTSEQWLELIHECQSSGMSERQWCILNDIPTSSYYYQMKKLRAEACDTLPADITPHTTVQKQEVVPVVFDDENNETYSSFSSPAITINIHGMSVSIHNGAERSVIENTISALKTLC